MSKEIYGFAEFAGPMAYSTIASALAASTPLGLFSVPDFRLHGFPSELWPAADAFVFVVGDSPKSMNSEYLLDNRDYDPQALIELPIKAEERLSVLVQLLSSFFTEHRCTRLAVCLTVCNEVDDVKYLVSSRIADVLREDCARECPPCNIYVITL
jgi:hypothetical protein